MDCMAGDTLEKLVLKQIAFLVVLAAPGDQKKETHAIMTGLDVLKSAIDSSGCVQRRASFKVRRRLEAGLTICSGPLLTSRQDKSLLFPCPAVLEASICSSARTDNTGAMTLGFTEVVIC
jgi:hypothetical protein